MIYDKCFNSPFLSFHVSGCSSCTVSQKFESFSWMFARSHLINVVFKKVLLCFIIDVDAVKVLSSIKPLHLYCVLLCEYFRKCPPPHLEFAALPFGSHWNLPPLSSSTFSLHDTITSILEKFNQTWKKNKRKKFYFHASLP